MTGRRQHRLECLYTTDCNLCVGFDAAVYTRRGAPNLASHVVYEYRRHNR